MMRELGVAVVAITFGCGAASAEPSALFLVPVVKPGDKFATIFSKATSIKGDGFDEFVGRVSGTGTDTIVSVSSDVTSVSETYRYDGKPSGSDVYEIRDHGMTNCYQGKCSANDETSAALFNPFLWGAIPKDIAPASTWTADIAAPWEIGPKGEEHVRVVRLDHDGGIVTLEREGDGTGPSSDDAHLTKRTIMSQGKSLSVTIIPGPTHWEGYTTVCRGVTLSDEIMASRHVTLVADTGEKFEGEERVYTLFIEMPAAPAP